MKGTPLTLKERTIVLVINVFFSYIVFVCASKKWLPTGGLESVWFVSALALWFLTLLSAPWFIPPRDVFITAIGSALILVTVDLNSVSNFQNELNYIRWISLGYCVVVTLTALCALFFHDRDQKSSRGHLFFHLSGIFGKGAFLYTPPALISILGTYQSDISTVGWLINFWVLLAVFPSVQGCFTAWKQFSFEKTPTNEHPIVGTIDRIDHPNILRVRLSNSSNWKAGSLFVAVMPNEDQRYTLALFTQVQGTDVIGTGLCVGSVAEPISALTGQVCATHDQQKATEFIENISGTKGAELIGFTVENSTIGVLHFEVAASLQLEEGDVVFTKINNQEVFYQINDAQTSEESFDQNPRGTHIVKAAQIGRYDEGKGFIKFPWLPAMNTPLFAAKNRCFPQTVLNDREFIIGTVPSTNIGIAVNIDDLVEYHTAILGVTGTGKTELALDVIREATKRKVKVFCVDFTGDYRHRLSDINPVFLGPSEIDGTELEQKLFSVETGKYGAPDEKKALNDKISSLQGSTREQIGNFLEPENSNLAIFEPAEITNTKATLRLTELYLSAIMDWARKNRRARQTMIVLEEAHTIVPEIHGSGFDNDTQWVVSRIGQIALQGRKYGVGLLVITQRTALVSKTILSQCNTFLTHSLIDQTSLNFLESVYSSQHTNLIPNLPNLHFLAFGKAVGAERPILLKREFDPAKKGASEKLRKPLSPETDLTSSP